MEQKQALHGNPSGAGCEPIPEKQAQILEAALHVFRERGFHEAKVEEIAIAASVGKGTIYEYFDTKTDLFQQTVKHHLFRFWQSAQEHVQAEASARDKIRRIVESEARLLAEENAVVSLLLQDPGPVSTHLKEWLWEQRAAFILDSIEGIVRQGIQDGELRPVDPRVAACFIFMVFHAFVALHALSPGRQPGSTPGDVDATLDILFNGLAS